MTRQKAGKSFMSLEAGERVLAPVPVAAGATQVACISEGSRLLSFAIEEVKVQAGGRGVILMALDKGEALVAVATGNGQRWEVEGAGRGGKVKTVAVGAKDMDKYRLHRARKGCLLPEKIKPSGIR